MLLAHHNTPQEGFGTSPAQCLLRRRTKTNLPTSSNLLKPSVAENTLEKDKLRKLKQKFYYDRSANNLQDLQKDDIVQMQPFWLNKKTWRKAKVLKPLGRRSYVVESNGQLYTWGGFSKKFYTGRLRPEVQPLTLLYTIFFSKGTSFAYLLLEKCTPFIYLLKKTYE